MSDDSAPETPAAEMFDVSGLAGRNIVVLATGSAGTAFLPSWVGWVMQAAPTAHFRFALSRSAREFVGVTAVQAFSGAAPLIDSWDETGREATHVELAQWANGYLVHPASMHFVSRLCAGLCDTPLLLAMQGSSAPIVVAAAAPPGFVTSAVWRNYLKAADDRPNLQILPPMEGVSAHDPALAGSPAVLFPAAAATLASAIAADATAADPHGGTT